MNNGKHKKLDVVRIKKSQLCGVVEGEVAEVHLQKWRLLVRVYEDAKSSIYRPLAEEVEAVL